MSRAGIGILLAALALPLPANAGQGDGSPTHQAIIAVRWDQPDRDLDAWRALRLEVSSTPGRWRRAWQFAAVSEERFGVSDQGVELGATLPLSSRWLLQADAGLAPDADFLPRHSLEVRAIRQLDHAVLASIGARSARYRDQRADRVTAGLERYVGNWRVGGAVRWVRVAGSTTSGQELALDRYFGDRDSVGLRLARGKELAPLPDGTRRLAGVQSVALVGRRWLSSRWGLQASVGYADQEGLYDHGWLQLGLMHGW